MVVKSSSAPPSPSSMDTSDPLRGVHKKKSSKETEVEFTRLKSLVPTISKKQSVSKLDVILEAIRYIDQLQDQLVEQINDNKISIAATALLVGKENQQQHQQIGSSTSSLSFEQLQQRQRRNSD